MSDVHTVQQLNRELARKINDETLKNPQSPYAHKYVGIANGQVVVVADDLDELLADTGAGSAGAVVELLLEEDQRADRRRREDNSGLASEPTSLTGCLESLRILNVIVRDRQIKCLSFLSPSS